MCFLLKICCSYKFEIKLHTIIVLWRVKSYIYYRLETKAQDSNKQIIFLKLATQDENIKLLSYWSGLVNLYSEKKS